MARTGRCLLWAAVAAGVVIVLAAAAVAVFWHLATAPAPQPAQAGSTAGPTVGAQGAPPASGASQTAASPGSPQRIGGGARQPRATQAAPGSTGGESFRLAISAGQLQQMAAAAVGNSVQGLQVAITGGQVVLSGKVKFGKRWVPVTVRTRPQAEGGRLRLVVTGAYIGRLPAPASARRDVQKKLDELTARALSHLPGAQVTSVQVTEGQIVIQGQMSGTR